MIGQPNDRPITARYISQISFILLFYQHKCFFVGGGDGLGTPAIAGVVIGVIILLVIVIVVIVFILLRRRKVSELIHY